MKNRRAVFSLHTLKLLGRCLTLIQFTCGFQLQQDDSLGFNVSTCLPSWLQKLTCSLVSIFKIFRGLKLVQSFPMKCQQLDVEVSSFNLQQMFTSEHKISPSLWGCMPLSIKCFHLYLCSVSVNTLERWMIKTSHVQHVFQVSLGIMAINHFKVTSSFCQTDSQCTACVLESLNSVAVMFFFSRVALYSLCFLPCLEKRLQRIDERTIEV